MEYLRASPDASAIVACTRGGAYEGGAVDARVERGGERGDGVGGGAHERVRGGQG